MVAKELVEPVRQHDPTDNDAAFDCETVTVAVTHYCRNCMIIKSI